MKKSAELYACLYAKDFPAQALLRLRPELRKKPCVVMEGDPPLQRVCSLNSRARALGISFGMTRVEIETFPSVSVLKRFGSEEKAASTALLECANAFSPRVEDQSNNNAFLCVIDIAGTEKLLGPPPTLGKNLFARARELGIVASVAISSNFHTAICVAVGTSSQTDVAIVASGDESTALGPLPLAVLDLPEQHAETFSLWGIQTLGQLAALPEKALIARMGQEGRRLRHLACGELSHLFLPTEPVFTLEERIELDSPVELLHSLLFVIGVMLEQLIVRATARMFALASVCITLFLEGGASHMRTVKSALPTNDRQLWIKLLHLDLEAHPPHAAILSLVLTAEPGSTSKVQLGLFSPQLPEPTRLDVTLARIRAIIGEDCVGRAVLRDTHQLDGSRIEPFTVPSGTASKSSGIQQPRAAMRQLRPAESVVVTLIDERPNAFSFRGKQYVVEHAYGPWITGGDWWNSTVWGLKQWDLSARSLDGLLLCCLAHDMTQNRWCMVALYD